jgi:hypothetical protein
MNKCSFINNNFKGKWLIILKLRKKIRSYFDLLSYKISLESGIMLSDRANLLINL